MKIKELYAKVAADAALQEVFAKILAETANVRIPREKRWWNLQRDWDMTSR